MFVLPFLFLISLTACRKEIDLKPRIKRTIDLDKNFIEKSALNNQWNKVKQHLLQVDGHQLRRQDQAYALYWMGVSNYYLGMRTVAKSNWEKAQSLSPQKPLQQQIQNAMRNYGQYENMSTPLPMGTWVLQCGVFSTKKFAEDLGRQLSWHGFDIHLDHTKHNQKESWVVWLGPFQAKQAQELQSKLKMKGFQSILKPSHSFL